MTWEFVDNPIADRQIIGDPVITDIDFLDESRGWLVTNGGGGVWFTDDVGKTWQHKLSGSYWALYADENGV